MSAVLTEPRAAAASAAATPQLSYEVSVTWNEKPDPELPYEFLYRKLGTNEWHPLDELRIYVEPGVSLVVFYLVPYGPDTVAPNFTTHPIQWVEPVPNSQEMFLPRATPGCFQVAHTDRHICTLTVTNTFRKEEGEEEEDYSYQFFICATYRKWLAGGHPTVTCLPDG